MKCIMYPCLILVFGQTSVVPGCVVDSGLESGQSGSQELGMGHQTS